MNVLFVFRCLIVEGSLFTAGEDSRICAWNLDSGWLGKTVFGLKPSVLRSRSRLERTFLILIFTALIKFLRLLTKKFEPRVGAGEISKAQSRPVVNSIICSFCKSLIF